jgi:hypothetical protein
VVSATAFRVAPRVAANGHECHVVLCSGSRDDLPREAVSAAAFGCTTWRRILCRRSTTPARRLRSEAICALGECGGVRDVGG